MWIRLLSIAFIVSLFAISCNKEPNLWDREEDLDVDTTTLLYSAKYISNLDTQVTLQLDVVTLNGLSSEISYAGQYYYDSVRSYANHTFDVSNVTRNSFSAMPYTTILLVDQNNPGWYTREKAGFYMRRYFESISNSTGATVGLASFKDDINKPTEFHSETTTNYLDNSWEFNTNTFYNLTEFEDKDNNVYTEINLEDIINRIDETIDHMVTLNDKHGDLSITFISSGNFLNGQASSLEIDNLIFKARSNQIRINLIGFDFDYNTSIRRLALETGGFIGSTQVGYESVSPIFDNTKKVSNLGVILQNLDLLLSRKVTSHRCNLVVNINAGQGAFTSGTVESIPVNYNGRLHTIQFTIP